MTVAPPMPRVRRASTLGVTAAAREAKKKAAIMQVRVVGDTLEKKARR